MLTIGENLKKIRIKNNLSQEELANKLNVHRTIISKWENNYLLSSIENLQMMARIYDVTIDELINERYIKNRKLKITTLFFIIIIIIFVLIFIKFKFVQNLHLLFWKK